jgi:hypothetical protein
MDGPTSTELYWDSNAGAARNWKWGGNSSASLAASLSSFSVLDEMVTLMQDRRLYPRLHSIIIAGHSAGGK